MAEAQGISTKIYVPGQDGYRPIGGRSGLRRQLTLDTVKEWIKLQGFDEYTTNGLIELASRYPTQALPSFRKNFNLMIQRVRAKRRQEQRGEQDVHNQETSQKEGYSQETSQKEIRQHEEVNSPRIIEDDGPDVIELS